LFAGCGDDGNVLGSDGKAGSAGQTAGGSAGNTAAAGHAGSMSTAGTSVGGTTSGGGKTGSGGASCDVPECLRANVCLDECGGKVIYSGCCACVAPAVEQSSCDAAGQAGSGGGDGGHDCGGTTCSTGETCVAHRGVGGAIFVPDSGGKCMAGKHVENGKCQNDFLYACETPIDCTAPSTMCHCDKSSSCGYTDSCSLPYAASWLDSSAELVCEAHFP
jgi:hypothetical protein